MPVDVIVAKSRATICMGRDRDAFDAVQGKRFDLVVFCAKEFGPPPEALGEAKVVRQRRAATYHCPLADAVLTRDEAFLAARASDLVASYFLKGKEVLVTCMQGRNRSALVVALALHRLSGEGGGAAVRAVRQRRLFADGPVLSNPTFVAYLESIPPRSGGPKIISLGTEQKGLIFP